MDNLVLVYSSSNSSNSVDAWTDSVSVVCEDKMPASVAVTGLPMSEQNAKRLQNYFSVTGRSGGDVIKKCYWDLQQEVFIIIYGSSERKYFHGI